MSFDAHRVFHLVPNWFQCADMTQVSEEVERALAKLGPPRLNGRFKKFFTI